MDHILCNLAGKFRYDTLNGRTHIVAPVTMIVPGVLNGSSGALFYSPQVATANPDSWNGMPIVVYHRDISYFVDWLGLKEVGSLEPKPGIPPSTGHLSKLLTQLESQPAKAVVYSPYNDSDAAKWLSEKAKIPVIALPYTVGGNDKAADLFGLFDDMIAKFLTAK